MHAKENEESKAITIRQRHAHPSYRFRATGQIAEKRQDIMQPGISVGVEKEEIGAKRELISCRPGIQAHQAGTL